MKMKHFAIITTILAAVVASGQADARLVSTKAQCVAVCGDAVSDSCGWITKRGPFNRCRVKLYNQCKRFGANVMCPAPPPASAPVPPTTVPPPPPAPTTTTTVPYGPPTTTTLPPPPVNPAAKFAGVWSFYGTLVSNSCNVGTIPVYSSVADTILLTVYPDTSAGGYLASNSSVYFSGGLGSDGWMTVGAQVINGSGCVISYGLSFGPFSSGTQTAGGFAAVWDCPYLAPCSYSYSGVWSR